MDTPINDEAGGEWRGRPKDTFGMRLVQIRHELGLSQAEAAKACGFKPASWHTWEHGRSPRDAITVATVIAATFGYDREWVAWGGARPQTPIIPGLTTDTRVVPRQGRLNLWLRSVPHPT